MTSCDQYRAIRLWGEALSSHPCFIQEQQRLAERTNAPLDAICTRHGSEIWATVRDLPSDHRFRVAYERG